MLKIRLTFFSRLYLMLFLSSTPLTKVKKKKKRQDKTSIFLLKGIKDIFNFKNLLN